MVNDGIMQYFAKLGLDASEFLNGIEKSQQGVLQFYRDVAISIGATMFIFDKFLQYGQKFIELSNQAMEYVSTIDKLSVTTGMSTEELQRWASVARYADSDINTLAMSVNKMQMNLSAQGAAGDAARQMLDDMNVSYRNMNGSLKSSVELFPAIIQGLKGLESSSDRVTAANAIFGQSYQSLAGYMNMSKSEMETYFSEASVLTEEQTQNLRDYEDAIKDLNASTGELANTAGAKLAPSFRSFAGLLDGLAKNQGILAFFSGLNLLLEMIAEGFVLLGGTASATYALISPNEEDFANLDAYLRKMGQMTRDVNIMRDRFAHPEAYLLPEDITTVNKILTHPEISGAGKVSEKEIIIQGIENIRAGTISLKDLKWAWDQGNISAQQYNDILGGLETSRLEDQKKAVDEIADAYEDLAGINKDFAREMSILNPRDVAGARNLILRYNWEVEDQQSMIAEAQGKVSTAGIAIEDLRTEYDGSEINLTVTVDTTQAEAQIQSMIYDPLGLVSDFNIKEPAGIAPIPSPFISHLPEMTGARQVDNLHLPEVTLPSQGKPGAASGDLIINIDSKQFAKIPGVVTGDLTPDKLTARGVRLA